MTSLKTGLSRRGLFKLGGSAFALAAMPASFAFAQASTDSANLAMIGEPPSMDLHSSTADLVGILAQHIYETLYTFDANFNIRPMLASDMPEISADGLTYTIPLRENVPMHNGRNMDSEDVVASLNRWVELTPRGKSVGTALDSITADGANKVVVKFTKPTPSFLAHMGLPSAIAGIMAKESIAAELTEFIGTGPYKFVERRPDAYVLMTRFDEYAARDDEPSGYAGRREAKIKDLRFIPVPNANTRVEGVLAGQYHFADQLPVESAGRFRNNAAVKPILTMPFGFMYFVANTAEGPFTNQKLRQAWQASLNCEEIMMVGFGDPEFFQVVPEHFPEGNPFHSKAGAEFYNPGNPEAAKKMLEEAGYDGTPIRILNSKAYEFHHRMALVMAENMKAAGFNVELDVVDWATLVQRRAEKGLWDIYITHSSFLPEPMLSPPQLGDQAPGWWESDAKKAALGAFNSESDPVKRGQLWGDVQKVVFDEVPYFRPGNFAALTAATAGIQGYDPMPYPAFWNTTF